MFTKIIDKHLPIISKRVKRHRQPVWITSEIITAIHNRKHAKKNRDHSQYKLWRNKTTQLKRESKKKHYTIAIHEHRNNPKMLAKVFNELNNKHSGAAHPTSLTYQNMTHTTDSDIADAFNHHFTSVAEKYLGPWSRIAELPTETAQSIKDYVNSKLPPGNIFKIPPITEHFVITYLSNLDISKSAGLDNISAKILKLSAPLIANQISKVTLSQYSGRKHA